MRGEVLQVRKRLNHRKLHSILEMMGYEIFTCNYSYGCHCYQIIGNGTQGEYFIKKEKGMQKLDLFGLQPELRKLVTEYYTEQGLNVEG